MALIFIFIQRSEGQMYTKSSETTGLNAATIVGNHFLGAGVKVIDVRYRGSAESMGIFTEDTAVIGMESGIVMSTGWVDLLQRNNDKDNTSSSGRWTEKVSDPHLEALSAYELHDMAILEIDIVPRSDYIEFRYVFASEEYPEFVCSQFNDLFGLFISGPSPVEGTYQAVNMALVGETNQTGAGINAFPVATNTVNPGVPGSAIPDSRCENMQESLDFSHLYNDNKDGKGFTLDGYSDILTARIQVIPCETYTVKMAVADSWDANYDSAVFLEANSLRSEGTSLAAIGNGPSNIVFPGSGKVGLELTVHETDAIDRKVALGMDDHTRSIMESGFITLSKSHFEIGAGVISDRIFLEPYDIHNSAELHVLRFFADDGTCSIDTATIVLRPDPINSHIAVLDSSTLCHNELPPLKFEHVAQPWVFVADDTSNVSSLLIQSKDIIGVREVHMPLMLNLRPKVCFTPVRWTGGGSAKLSLHSPSGEVFKWRSDHFHTADNPPRQECSDGLIAVQQHHEPPDSSLYRSDQAYSLVGRWTLLVEQNDAILPLETWSLQFENPWEATFMYYDLDGAEVGPENRNESDTLVVRGFINHTVKTDTVVIRRWPSIPTVRDLACYQIDRDTLVFTWDKQDHLTYVVTAEGNSWAQDSTEVWFSDLSADKLVEFSITPEFEGCKGETVITTCKTPPCPTEKSIDLKVLPPPSWCINHGSILINTDINNWPLTYILNGETFDMDSMVMVPVGDHEISITDRFGCEETFKVNMTASDTMLVNVIASKGLCGVPAETRIDISDPQKVQKIEWSNGHFGPQTSFDTGGMHFVWVEDDYGCSVLHNFKVYQTQPIEITQWSITDASCHNASDGKIQYDISGGNGIYSDIIKSLHSNEVKTNLLLARGEYSLEISDTDGCGYQRVFFVDAPAEPVIQAQIKNVSCKDGSDGSVYLDAKNMREPLSVYDDAGMLKGREVLGLKHGTYNFTLVDSTGCSARTTIVVSEPREYLEVAFEQEPPRCIESNDGAIRVSVTGGVGPYTTVVQQAGKIFTHDALPHGFFTLNVLDAAGCEVTVEDIYLNRPDSLWIDLELDTAVNEGENVKVVASYGGNQGEVNVDWRSDPHGVVPCNACDQWEVRRISESFIVQVHIQDSIGCRAMDEKKVFVTKSNHIAIPEAFTPNDDGVNDLLTIFGTPGTIVHNFKLFTYGGVIVYAVKNVDVNDILEGWDGRFKGIEMPAGSYAWVLEVTFPDGRNDTFHGATQLVRQ